MVTDGQASTLFFDLTFQPLELEKLKQLPEPLELSQWNSESNFWARLSTHRRNHPSKTEHLFKRKCPTTILVHPVAHEGYLDHFPLLLLILGTRPVAGCKLPMLGKKNGQT